VRAPGAGRPVASAAVSAGGMAAAEVLPVRAIGQTALRDGTPSRSVTAWMMRPFTWCGTRVSTIPGLHPQPFSTREADSAICSTARRWTLRPAMPDQRGPSGPRRQRALVRGGAAAQHHRARAFAGDRGPAAVRRVDDPGVDFGRHDQDAVDDAAGDQAVGHRGGVDEPAAHGGDAERRDLPQADVVGGLGRCGRARAVRCRGGQHHAADRSQARRAQRVGDGFAGRVAH
jgi:hypothetical protein